MKIHIYLSILIFILILVAAATGVFYRTNGAHIVLATVRGEQATYQGSGLYRYDPASFAREGVIWDVINLFISIPAWIVVPLIQDGKTNGIEAVPFLIVSLLGMALAGMFYRNV